MGVVREVLSTLIRHYGLQKVLKALIENLKETERAYVEDHGKGPDESSEKVIAGLEAILVEYDGRYPEWCGKCAQDGSCVDCLR